MQQASARARGQVDSSAGGSDWDEHGGGGGDDGDGARDHGRDDLAWAG